MRLALARALFVKPDLLMLGTLGATRSDNLFAHAQPRRTVQSHRSERISMARYVAPSTNHSTAS